MRPRGTPARLALVAFVLLWGGLPGVAASFAQGRDDLERGRRLLARGAARDAARVLRAVVRARPDDPEAQLLLGRALALVPEPSEALTALRRAVELRPTSAEAHYTLGTALARFTAADAAEPLFQRALELDPRFADAHVSLALIRAQGKDLPAARDHLTRAIEIQGRSPASAYSHYLIAQILREQGELDAALQHLAAAIERRPQYGEAYLARGLINRERRDETEARRAFETAVKLSPDDPTAQSELGAAYLRSGRPTAALPHFERALRLKPDDRSTHAQLCRALQLAGRSGDADRCAAEIAARFSADAAADDLALGRANNEGVRLEAAGDLAAAIDRYRFAVAGDPSNATFRRNLALALCRMERWDEAIAELKKVLATNPNDPDATRALYIAVEQAKKKR